MSTISYEIYYVRDRPERRSSGRGGAGAPGPRTGPDGPPARGRTGRSGTTTSRRDRRPAGSGRSGTVAPGVVAPPAGPPGVAPQPRIRSAVLSRWDRPTATERRASPGRNVGFRARTPRVAVPRGRLSGPDRLGSGGRPSTATSVGPDPGRYIIENDIIDNYHDARTDARHRCRQTPSSAATSSVGRRSSGSLSAASPGPRGRPVEAVGEHGPLERPDAPDGRRRGGSVVHGSTGPATPPVAARRDASGRAGDAGRGKF